MYLNYIKDTIGNNYVGINYDQQTVQSYLDKMKEFLKDEYDTYVENQQNRDHNRHHMTVLSVMDYNDIIKRNGVSIANEITKDFSHDFCDIRYMGLGRATSGSNTAYFVVCKSEQLQIFRRKYGLPDKDLHITLGFKWKDVFNVPKNEVLSDVNPFKDILKKSYDDNYQSFDFLKDIRNYDYDKKATIYPIEINDRTATFRIDSNDYCTVSLINNEYLYITNKWQSEKNIPYLANTIVSRKLNT